MLCAPKRPFANASAPSCSSLERSKQGLFDAARVPLLVSQNIEGASRQVEPDAMESFGGERLRNNKIGNRGGAVAGFYGGADGLTLASSDALNRWINRAIFRKGCCFVACLDCLA
jgi:hypothetical protein